MLKVDGKMVYRQLAQLKKAKAVNYDEVYPAGLLTCISRILIE
jgi:hypothetical protein